MNVTPPFVKQLIWDVGGVLYADYDVTLPQAGGQQWQFHSFAPNWSEMVTQTDSTDLMLYHVRKVTPANTDNIIHWLYQIKNKMLGPLLKLQCSGIFDLFFFKECKFKVCGFELIKEAKWFVYFFDPKIFCWCQCFYVGWWREVWGYV